MKATTLTNILLLVVILLVLISGGIQIWYIGQVLAKPDCRVMFLKQSMRMQPRIKPRGVEFNTLM